MAGDEAAHNRSFDSDAANFRIRAWSTPDHGLIMVVFANRLEDALAQTRRCFQLFEGRDDLISTLDAAAKQVDVPAMIIGAAAMPKYAYNRATEDIDIVTSVDDAYKLGDHLQTIGEFEFIGHSKFKHRSGIDVNFCPTGVIAGHCKFPTPESTNPGLTHASLPMLLALKAQANRYKDRADFVELVKRNKLSMEYLEQNVFPKLSTFYQQLASKLWQSAQEELSEELDRAEIFV